MICVSGRMTWITLTSRSCLPHLRQRWDAVWDGLDTCPRTCPTEDSRLCRYKNWFARPAGRLLGHFWICPSPCATCSTCCACALEMAAPGTLCAKNKQSLYIVPAGCLKI